MAAKRSDQKDIGKMEDAVNTHSSPSDLKITDRLIIWRPISWHDSIC